MNAVNNNIIIIIFYLIFFNWEDGMKLLTFILTFIHSADDFIQSDLQMRNTTNDSS